MRPDDLFTKPVPLVLALALLSLLPFAFMSMTAFVKISTVFQILKSAIGAQSIPSNTVVMALSASLTLLAMAPVGDKIMTRLTPVLHEKSQDTVSLATHGIDAVREPLREFLRANASDVEVARFVAVAKKGRTEAESKGVSDRDFSILAPSFVVSELTRAFSIGFLLFLPFLVIDLVVANVLLALGMQMMSPTQVSLPFKLLLFVSIGGFGLLSQALIASYR